MNADSPEESLPFYLQLPIVEFLFNHASISLSMMIAIIIKKQLPDPFYNVGSSELFIGNKVIWYTAEGTNRVDTEASLFNMHNINNTCRKCICFNLLKLPQQGFIVI